MNKWFMNKHTKEISQVDFCEVMSDYVGQITVIQFTNGDRWSLDLLLAHWVEVKPIIVSEVVWVTC